MKLPSFSVGKKQKELYLSLLLYPDAVDAAAWELEKTGEAFIAGAVTQELSTDAWEERNDAADKCVSTLEAITKTENINKVILGLPAEYLTEEGDVKKEIKQHIKQLTHALELSPIGFVSIYQAIIHYYKRKEGVPPSLILLGITGAQQTVSLYKVGNFLGHKTVPKDGSFIGHLEDALSGFDGIEILPSRILIYGTDRAAMEDAKRQILEHHWHQKTNFLHFPKAEVLSGDAAAIAVSYAGAAELGETMIEDEFDEEQSVVQEENKENAENDTVAPVAESEAIKTAADNNFPVELASEKEKEKEVETEVLQTEEIVENEVQYKEDSFAEDRVTAQTYGFNDIEELSGDDDIETEHGKPADSIKKKKMSLTLPPVFASISAAVAGRVAKIKSRQQPGSHGGSRRISAAKSLLIVGILVLVLGTVGIFLITQLLPHATVAISVQPRDIQASERLSVEVNALSEGTVLGSKNLEQTVQGEETVQVTGKRTIGDPAKGTITIFNKSTLSRTFRKGTVVSSGSIEFTLDDDVQVASASETFTGSTFGRANAAVTAREIGSRGNLAAGREFSVSGVSSSVATARNEAAFTGGTSKEITVVSRADQDSLLKQLTNDLIAEAKAGFAAGDGELLINETVKTEVEERSFSHEIGQEAQELQGKATITITGVAYKDADIRTVMKEALQKSVMSGFKLAEDSIQIQTAPAVVSRTGDIALAATASARLIPSFDIETLIAEIQGKSVTEAQELIRTKEGVSDVSVTVSQSLFRNRLPSRAQNIKVSIQTQ